MKNVFLFFFSFISFTILAQKANFVLKSVGSVTDFVVENDTIYASTDFGQVDIFSLKTKKKIHSIFIPKIKDFANQPIPTKIFSIDKLPQHPEVLIVTQGKKGYRNVFLVKKDGKLTQIISASVEKLFIKRAKFITKNKILLGLLSNELILFDIEKKQEIYRKQVSTAVFSDFCLNSTRQIIFSSDESGTVTVFGALTGVKMNFFDTQNKDRVFQADYKNKKLITAGKDRNVGVYNFRTKKAYSIKSDFFVYCVALNNKATLGAFSANEQNDIFVFDTSTKQIKYKLLGQQTTQTKIYFLNEHTLISSAEDSQLLIWNLK